MRNYFLLEAGDTMYDFYTAIFERVLEKESWQQLSFLNAQLQEAVGQRHPEDSSRYCTQEILMETRTVMQDTYKVSYRMLFTMYTHLINTKAVIKDISWIINTDRYKDIYTVHKHIDCY